MSTHLNLPSLEQGPPRRMSILVKCKPCGATWHAETWPDDDRDPPVMSVLADALDAHDCPA